MKKNNKYYNFEFCLFSYHPKDIFDLIIENYLREIVTNINSDILVISSNKKQFNLFYKKVSNLLNILTIEDVYENQKRNGLVKRYLENHQFQINDLDYMKKTILNKISNVDNNKKYFDIVILDESITKLDLKKLVLAKTQSDKDIGNLLEQHFIYILNYQREFKKIYDYFE